MIRRCYPIDVQKFGSAVVKVVGAVRRVRIPFDLEDLCGACHPRRCPEA